MRNIRLLIIVIIKCIEMADVNHLHSCKVRLGELSFNQQYNRNKRCKVLATDNNKNSQIHCLD